MLGAWPEGLAAADARVRLVENDGSQRAYPCAPWPSARCRGIPTPWCWSRRANGRAARQLATYLPADGLALTLPDSWGYRERLEQAQGNDRWRWAAPRWVLRCWRREWCVGGQGRCVGLPPHPAFSPAAGAANSCMALAWGKLVIKRGHQRCFHAAACQRRLLAAARGSESGRRGTR